MIHYGMTKTGQVAIARGMAESVRRHWRHCKFHSRRATASEGAGRFVERIAKEQGVTPAEIEKQFFATVRPTSLLKRFQTPEEVAAVVAFVASSQAISINGSAVRAEGGVIRSIF